MTCREGPAERAALGFLTYQVTGRCARRELPGSWRRPPASTCLLAPMVYTPCVGESDKPETKRQPLCRSGRRADGQPAHPSEPECTASIRRYLLQIFNVLSLRQPGGQKGTVPTNLPQLYSEGAVGSGELVEAGEEERKHPFFHHRRLGQVLTAGSLVCKSSRAPAAVALVHP